MTADHRLKLARANQHLNKLDHSQTIFLRGKPTPFHIVSEYDERLGEYRLWGKVIEQPPEWWGPIIGDFCHNLRSGLDALAFALAGAQAGAHTEFPIFRDKGRFRQRTNRNVPAPRSGLFKMKGMPARAQGIIESYQPYNAWQPLPATNAALGILHDLSLHDKHRRIHLVAAATSSVYSAVRGPQTPTMSANMPRWEPFKDGQELAPLAISVGSSDPRAKHHVGGTFDIALDPSGPAAGMPMRQCLIDCREAVVEVFEKLERFL